MCRPMRMLGPSLVTVTDALTLRNVNACYSWAQFRYANSRVASTGGYNVDWPLWVGPGPAEEVGKVIV